MLFSTQQRIESLLTTIDRLGIVKIKHLQQIHDLNYRNACRIISSQLRPFIHETFYQKEKVIYLNKKGRELIASEKEVQVNQQTLHSLLRNGVYIHFNCPSDWQNEYTLETAGNALNSFGISFQIGTLTNTKKLIADAVFKRNGYMNIIEVDNEQKMSDNKKKIDSYKDVLPAYKSETPILYFFTKTENRKRKLEEWMKGIRHEVKTFEEIK